MSPSPNRFESLDDADDMVSIKSVGNDADSFMALVDKVIVGDDFMFIMKDGSMWTSPLRNTTPGERDQLDQDGQQIETAG